MRTILWSILSIITILIILTIVAMLSYQSVMKIIPVDCNDEAILESLYSKWSVRNFQEDYPGHYFENQGSPYLFTSQCQYWFVYTDGMKQENLWMVFDTKGSYFISETRLCFDNNQEEPVRVNTSKFPEFTQENCK